MKNVVIIITGTFALLIACRSLSNAYAQTGPNAATRKTEQLVPEITRRAARPRTNFVRTVNFYLRDENLVFGKLISEDKNKITLERLDGSRIIVATYSKREIDTRTLRFKNIPEAKYYLDLAEYFSGRTWDFRDDPDDFIQAIRCCEKAKRSTEQAQGPDSERTVEISEKIKKLQADRKIWVREVESRAKLKKLEFEATIETRLKELEDKATESSLQIDKTVANTKDNQQKLERAISGMDRLLSGRLEILEDEVETNSRIIDRIDRTRYHYPRYYYP